MLVPGLNGVTRAKTMERFTGAPRAWRLPVWKCSKRLEFYDAGSIFTESVLMIIAGSLLWIRGKQVPS
jgi:hypothetical protein